MLNYYFSKKEVIFINSEHKRAILVAENEDSIRKLISFKLNKKGYLVKEVKNGEEVMKELCSNSYAALILDLMLPMLTGMQVLKKIQEEKIDIPVLIVSAKSQEKDIIRAFKLGADDYLSKPFRPQELIIRLKRLLN